MQSEDDLESTKVSSDITVALSGVKSSQALLLSILQSCMLVRKPGFKAFQG